MSKIYVADIIMGGGKTSGAITYMLQNPDKKYIYIAPFLNEAERIANACGPLNFALPKQISEYNRSKILHIEQLVKEDRNIACSHVAFSALTRQTIELINEKRYTLICDETVDAVKVDSVYVKDMLLLEKAGMLRREDDAYKFTGDDDYIDGNSLYTDLCRLSRNNNVYFEDETLPSGKKEQYFYLLLPPEIFECFETVIILTYMFESSNLKSLLDLYGCDYEYIGIERVDFGNTYILSKTGLYVPEYIYDLKNKINIYEYDTNPIIGRGRPPKNLNKYRVKKGRLWEEKDFKPTMTFFRHPEKYSDLYNELKNNQLSFFEKVIKQFGGTKNDCMWGTYKIAASKLEGRGLRKKFVPFNSKATNEYRTKKYVSYICDLHLSPQLTRFFKKHNIGYDEKAWALSTMLQFIWRSQCRDGKEIQIYIPSFRMRNMLTSYLDDLSKGIVHASADKIAPSADGPELSPRS